MIYNFYQLYARINQLVIFIKRKQMGQKNAQTAVENKNQKILRRIFHNISGAIKKPGINPAAYYK